MPIEQTIEANEARIRRMSQDDSDETKHYTLTVEDEAGNSFRARIPPDEFEPELDRYVEEQLRSAVQDLDEWFHKAFTTELEAEATAIADTVHSGIGRIKSQLDLRRPQSSSEASEASGDDGVQSEDAEEVEAATPGDF